MKDNIGRIHFIPYASFINTGARIAAQQPQTEIKVYPNPIIENNDLSVSFETENDNEVDITLKDNNGNILFKSEKKIFAEGIHNYNISLDDIKFSKNQSNEFIYVHIQIGDKIQKLKVVTNK